MELPEQFNEVLLITSGAILGANIRFFIYKRLEKINLSKNFIILLINAFSSFLLGLFLSIFSHTNTLDYSHQLGLFFSIGLLGSLSTFSTFIYDLFELILQLKFYRAFKLFSISLISGILFFAFGFSLEI